MSKTAALVVEGQSDVPILRSIIRKLWPEVGPVVCLQPELDEYGRARLGASAGWSEVKAWCEQNAGRVEEILDPGVGDPVDLLVVAMDVDVAVRAGLQKHPANVGAYDAEPLRRIVEGWLRGAKGRLPGEVVVTTPVMAIEAWAIAALFPRERHPEQIRSPAMYLVQRKKLALGSDGRPRKAVASYREFGVLVAARLRVVRRKCQEAESFAAHVLGARLLGMRG